MKMKFLEELKSLMLKVKLKCKIKVSQYMKILFLKKKLKMYGHNLSQIEKLGKFQ